MDIQVPHRPGRHVLFGTLHGVYGIRQRRAQVDSVQGVLFRLDTAVVSSVGAVLAPGVDVRTFEVALYPGLVVVLRDLQHSFVFLGAVGVDNGHFEQDGATYGGLGGS